MARLRQKLLKMVLHFTQPSFQVTLPMEATHFAIRLPTPGWRQRLLHRVPGTGASATPHLKTVNFVPPSAGPPRSGWAVQANRFTHLPGETGNFVPPASLSWSPHFPARALPIAPILIAICAFSCGLASRFRHFAEKYPIFALLIRPFMRLSPPNSQFSTPSTP
jgi:hypothetical protein